MFIGSHIVLFCQLLFSYVIGNFVSHICHTVVLIVGMVNIMVSRVHLG